MVIILNRSIDTVMIQYCNDFIAPAMYLRILLKAGERDPAKVKVMV